jgi:hypothetical protein
MAFTEDGVLLGAGTVLASRARSARRLNALNYLLKNAGLGRYISA